MLGGVERQIDRLRRRRTTAIAAWRGRARRRSVRIVRGALQDVGQGRWDGLDVADEQKTGAGASAYRQQPVPAGRREPVGAQHH
ncbi:hypothetical protein MDOR_33190 [Mycolicibacterium doricum]|uniref:Uncharacterized protein n=1 Tax=Mycolicibacterium doricum TaxID=126673 RepID=A0A1X1TIG9_9MYCO|nr:hypothetical protein AWC01_03640 [Mycolicibacterium doricum]BBZ09150.1 hypothetical protein MDOR_33190 [Mycolicibacterium doricum]